MDPKKVTTEELVDALIDFERLIDRVFELDAWFRPGKGREIKLIDEDPVILRISKTYSTDVLAALRAKIKRMARKIDAECI